MFKNLVKEYLNESGKILDKMKEQFLKKYNKIGG